jgi:hypothetical protein
MKQIFAQCPMCRDIMPAKRDICRKCTDELTGRTAKVKLKTYKQILRERPREESP